MTRSIGTREGVQVGDVGDRLGDRPRSGDVMRHGVVSSTHSGVGRFLQQRRERRVLQGLLGRRVVEHLLEGRC